MTHLKVVLRQTIYKKFCVYMTVNMLILGKHVCNAPWSVGWWFACSFVVGCGLSVGKSLGNLFLLER